MATTPGPKAPVAPPVALPPTRSLLQAITPVADLERGWEAGISHVEGRGAFVGAPQDWCSPDTLSITDACDQANRTSFVLYAGELRPNQSTFGGRGLQERLDSARVNLEYHQSFALARELMYGTVTVAESWGNPYLTDPAALQVVTLGAQPYMRAIDRITKRWAMLMAGERGLIHASPSVAGALLFTQRIVERGGQLFDAVMGHQVVVDAGYAGATNAGAGAADPATTFDPLGQVEWVFMSPNIDIRLSPITFIPGSEAEMFAAVDRAANKLTVIAYRTVSYTYETPAGSGTVPPVLGVPVDLCSPDCIPGAS